MSFKFEKDKFSNSMIQMACEKHTPKVVIKVLREAKTTEDVQLCLTSFHGLFLEAKEQDIRAKIFVDTSAVVLNVANVNWTIIRLIQTHFKQNLTLYINAIDVCAILVANEPLSKLISGVVAFIVADRKIFVTATKEKAIEFLARAKK